MQSLITNLLQEKTFMKSLGSAINNMSALHVEKNLHMQNSRIITSQIYKLHVVVPYLCEICYLIGLYYLNMNVVHYLNLEVVCTSFMCKQHE